MAYYPEVAMFEAFSGYNDQMLGLNWTVTTNGAFPTIVSSTNRRGEPSVKFRGSATIVKGIPTGYNTSIYGTVGFNVKITSYTSAGVPNIFWKGLSSVPADMIQLGVSSTLQVQVYKSDATVLYTSPTAMTVGNDMYMELGFISTNTFGCYSLRLNGAAVSESSATVATATTSRQIHSVQLGAAGFSGNTNIVISDFYYCNTISFLGDCRVDTYEYSGDGTGTLSLTTVPTTTTHFWSVTDGLTINTVNYVISTIGQDSYTKSAMSHTPQIIYGAKQVWYVNKNDAGARNINGYMRISATDYTPGATQAIPTGAGITAFEEYVLTDPRSTATAFTQAAFDALELGPKLS